MVRLVDSSGLQIIRIRLFDSVESSHCNTYDIVVMTRLYVLGVSNPTNKGVQNDSKTLLLCTKNVIQGKQVRSTETRDKCLYFFA